MKDSKSILVLSDIHCGSIYAPSTKEPYIKQAKTTWNPSPLQKAMLDNWMWVKDELIQDPYLTVINGEPVDGDNYRENGGRLWTSDVNDQIDDFIKLMKMYPRSDYITMTRGSGYHVLKGNTSYEDTVARALGVKRWDTMREAEDHRTWDNQNRHVIPHIDDILTFGIKPSGVMFNVAHHIGYNKAYHNKTQAATAMLAALEFMRGKYWDDDNFPDIVIRGHVHYYAEVRFARIRAWTCPCFKLSLDRFMTRTGVPEPPSIGAVEVIVESNGHVMVEPHIIPNSMYPKYDVQWY